jgi:hypothetical protein
MYTYGTKYLNRRTTPRRMAGKRDVPDMTTSMMVIFMKTSVTNIAMLSSLETFFNVDN